MSSCTNYVLFKNIPVRNVPFIENFDSQEAFNTNWIDNSFGHPKSYHLEKNSLKITTRPNSKDRIKVKTKRKNFNLGTYEWSIYVPKFDLYDQSSIGAFIYHSGKIPYEIDFEIGSGNKEDREEVAAKPNEAIVHCTSQYSPNSSGTFKVTAEQWHTFKLELTKIKNLYVIKWYINDVLVKTLQTKIKTKHKFTVHNSLENLSFMGEHLPSKKNYVLFNSFTFK
ncbi:hypothetical protein KCTC32516_01069 [Polaribacter huanghezhanensis]|uniref:hypothetical protein n=1 Tax=Polaribacter huanghezhanensis TaxID=1354726 RepID=UPI0026488BF6|nr:hypothetical protein [Polaribacter huanghezhanensis]WKD85724.1 hypothetical protein KCTC32516_01069 [Polaribacter huanghezhanensis]